MTYIERTPDHFYKFDGQVYPGVTNVLKVLDKSGPLMAWAARMTAEAALRVDLAKLLEGVGPEGVVKALTSRSAWVNEQARDLGTRIHGYADDLVMGRPLPELAGEDRVRIEHYAEWWSNSGWRLRASEALLVNPGKGYGGTLDLLCYDRDGRTVLADIKSGRIDYRGQVYDSIILQLAAYGDTEFMETAGALYVTPIIERYVVIQVTADGVREVEVAIGEAERRAFGACLELARWRESVKGKRA